MVHLGEVFIGERYQGERDGVAKRVRRTVNGKSRRFNSQSRILPKVGSISHCDHNVSFIATWQSLPPRTTPQGLARNWNQIKAYINLV